MPIIKKILVLAKSIKQGGRCVAGRFIEKRDEGWRVGDWCRPILPDGEGRDSIPEGVCRTFSPLDVISLELGDQEPAPGQPENWLWSRDTPITQEHSFNRVSNSLEKMVETPKDLWLDLGAYRPDAVRHTHPVEQSLYLVQPSNFMLTLYFDDNGRKKISGRFAYQGHIYEDIPVTDPVMFLILSNQFPKGEAVTMPLRNGDRYWLTMSIGQPFGPMNCRYKFIAAVIDHSGYLQRKYR